MLRNAQKIKHLYARAGFGLSLKEWQERSLWSVDKAVNQLFAEAKGMDLLPQHAFVNKIRNATKKKQKKNASANKMAVKLRKEGRMLVGQLNADWVKRMGSEEESSLAEKMCLFWHGHFACVSKNPILATNQLNIFRAHGLGKFKDLVLAIAKDPSMIRFLNNQQNRKNSPNENFTRELMELFTLGRGNYTEEDIKEGARAFTGWSSNMQGDFVFRKRQHDYGQKRFMGETGDFDGEDIIDIILAKQEAAAFITRKVYRYFVNHKVDEDRVLRLSKDFYRSGYDIEALMRNIFSSDWFYNPENIGTKIKSPIEYLAGLIRTFDLRMANWNGFKFTQQALGQVLFNPPNVAGWPGGRAWIDNATLMLRLNLIEHFNQQSEVNIKLKEEFEAKRRNKRQGKLQAKMSMDAFVEAFSALEEEEILEELIQYLFPKGAINERLINRYTFHHSKQVYIKSSILRLTSLPEYQLC